MKVIKWTTGIITAIAVIASIIAFIAERFEKPCDFHKPNGVYEKYIKRPLDVFLSTVALIVLAPYFIVIALLVRIELGSPVLFMQDRPGMDEEIFKLFKFRTMTDERDGNGNLLPDEDRLPPFGRKLRATSLDELPELVNIIRGDMAIVGPRPLLVRYLPRYNEEQHHRHDVRPGLTGYAQVHGRNAVSWQDKFDFDLEYVDHITFKGDMKIIIETVGKVIRKDGISSNASITMEEFMGNKN